MEGVIRTVKRLVPKRLFRLLAPAYHYVLSFVAALRYGFPSRSLTVIGVTGTKGKTSTAELLYAMLSEAGYKTALAGTLHFVIGDKEEPNKYKMTMPGRFVLRRFLRKAVSAGCTHAVLEMTSQGVVQFRHKHISLDALVFTNISPEHIESHGSFEKYLEAKLKLADALAHSGKKRRVIIANADDEHGKDFLACGVDRKIPFSIKEVEPVVLGSHGSSFMLWNNQVHSKLPGLFNIYNILGAAKAAQAFGVPTDTIIQAIQKRSSIRGRVEDITVSPNQPFRVVVDYAHTPDSLEKLYGIFKGSRIIGVMGGTGGGRDVWKRTEMARIAEAGADWIIFTNEDPYDEDPDAIVKDLVAGLKGKNYEIEMDRRKAIRKALERARPDDVVLITGKGTDPYIMGPHGTKEAWDDAQVAREELTALFSEKSTEKEKAR